jgi:peroxiredoxin
MICFLAGCITESDRTQMVTPGDADFWEVGHPAPDLELPDQHGVLVSLERYRGRVVLLALSACWCAPCWDLAHDVEALAARFGDRDFAHLTVLLEDPSGLSVDPADAAAWARWVGATGPVLADADRRTERALAGGFPTVLILDRELTLVAVTDAVDPATLVDLLEAELSP